MLGCDVQEILEVEQVTEESQGMELNDENVDQVCGGVLVLGCVFV
jgi:hypothetical protein